ncbi:hypothetical protein G6L79_31715 [Agrobacterium rhizogenes]|nr:hypothetical protein [Rhizobium rhizogenes]
MRQDFGDRACLALTLFRRPNDHLRLHKLSNLSAQAGVPTVVTKDVLYHDRGSPLMQDIATGIRHNCTIDHRERKHEWDDAGAQQPAPPVEPTAARSC